MSSLDNFPDPSSPQDPIPGDPIPVSLITQPFAQELGANVGTGGTFSFDQTNPTKTNPLDLFHTLNPHSGSGVALLIMNSLTTPLTLVDSLQNVLDSFSNGPQLGYPAVIDPVTQKAVKTHQIPGVRQYPRPSLHKAPDGSPALVGGIGLYRFQCADIQGVSFAKRGLAFACAEDASKNSKPLLGVVFSYRSDWQLKGPVFNCAVSADLTKQGKADTQSNLSSLMDSLPAPQRYDRGTTVTNTMIVWGLIPPGKPAFEPNMVTLVVWVRDIASTFG
jgi:hypothetical protein